ncbi:hypothetical protein P8452_68990 [Trifolium repens]|nr:hypothetical protein P8452_68990 [Trifolium repens]
MQAFLREYGTEHSGGRRGSGESCGCYLKSYGSGMQDLHEGGRHSEVVILVVLAMVVGSKWKRSRFKWDLDLAGDLG